MRAKCTQLNPHDEKKAPAIADAYKFKTTNKGLKSWLFFLHFDEIVIGCR